MGKASGVLLALTLATGGSAMAQAADYVFVRHMADVKATPDAVWARIGDFCGIAKLLDTTCSYASGTGDVATVRVLVNGAVQEPMIAKTAHSYTYSQIRGDMKDFDYHGTLAVEPAGRGHSTIVYTLVYDQALMPSDAVRAAQRAQIETRFKGAIDRAKMLAEAK